MKVLVIGVGVIGGELTHVLCKAGNQVTCLARGTWADALETQGLCIHHTVQRRDTVDRPRIVRALDPAESFDICFAAMRQDQMVVAAPMLAGVNAPVVACVGNDLRTDEVEEAVLAQSASPASPTASAQPASPTASAQPASPVQPATPGALAQLRPKEVIFGFGATAGVRDRESGTLTAVHWRGGSYSFGGRTGQASAAARELVDQALQGSGASLDWQPRMDDWLLWHALSVMPMCFVAYAHGLDLRRATGAEVGLMLDAMNDVAKLMLADGRKPLPAGDERSVQPGPLRTVSRALMWAIFKTKIGELCVGDHCRNAVDEMESLDRDAERWIASHPAADVPNWSRLRSACPAWPDLHARWDIG